MKKTDWKMSASFIRALKACPTRCRLAYIEGLRPAEDTESQRTGTIWHKLLEIVKAPVESPCICFARRPDLEALADANCPICQGIGLIPNSPPLDRAVAWLNHRYDTVPPNKDATEWAVERAILAYSLAGYLWYYGDDQIETIATEVKFDLPFRNPATGRALPHVRRVGKIDRVIRQDGLLKLNEYKSTSKSIDSGSSYWDRLTLDTQISHYVEAAQELQRTGKLSAQFITAGLGEVPVLIAETLYDVWHRPGIRPKKLTQAESKAFVESGEYCGQKFEVRQKTVDITEYTEFMIDGVIATIELGKKEGTFAIRETPDMFGARLLADITARPEFYFARRPIARTADQIKRHAGETLHIFQMVRSMNRTGCWWSDESQCEATFKCPYTSICYHGQDVFDGKTTPPGFRRIFDLEKTVVEDE